MITLLDVVFAGVQMALSMHGDKLPAELVAAAQSAVDAWAKHRDDVVTKNAVDAAKA